MQDLPFCFVFRGEKIKVDFKLKLNVGAGNFADIKFNGEATEAAKDFFTNGYLAALNVKMEFCDDEECYRMKICGTDLCNTFEPNKNWIERRVGFITESPQCNYECRSTPGMEEFLLSGDKCKLHKYLADQIIQKWKKFTTVDLDAIKKRYIAKVCQGKFQRIRKCQSSLVIYFT